MQAKVLQMKFQGWKFCGWPVDCENLENIPQKFVHIRYEGCTPENKAQIYTGKAGVAARAGCYIAITCEAIN